MFHRISFQIFVVLAASFPFTGALALDFELKSISLTSLSPGCKNFQITEFDRGGISASIGRRKQLRRRRRCKLGFQIQSELSNVALPICRRFQAYLYQFHIKRNVVADDSPVTRILESDECGEFTYTLRTRKRRAREKRWHIAIENLSYEVPVEVPYIVVPYTGKVCLQVLTCGLDVATGEVAIYSNSCGVDGEKVIRASDGACGMGGVFETLDS